MDGQINIPLEFKELTPEETAIVVSLTDDPSHQHFIRIGPKGYSYVKDFEKYAADIYNMELRKGDIFVSSFKRSGTTLTQELVWLISNNLDYNTAQTIPLTARYTYLERIVLYNDESKSKALEMSGLSEKIRQLVGKMSTPATEMLANLPSPRFMKTHLPLTLLPPKLLDTAKVVYLARDPRDVAVSCYHLCRLFESWKFKASFKQFWNAFVKDLYSLTPYFEHVKEAWAQRNHPNMLFLFYEDIVKDIPAFVRQVSDYFGKVLTPEELERLYDHLSIDSFRKNIGVNMEDFRELGLLSPKVTFIGKGEVGGWREYFDEELSREAEQWIEDNLRDSDLRFPSIPLAQ